MTTLTPAAPVINEPREAVLNQQLALAIDDDWFKPCVVVPVYNHERSLPSVVQALLAEDLPCVLVDDASSPVAAAVIDELAQHPSVHLVRHRHNQGKGAAVANGLREASRLGFSHALQIDADGQHDLGCLSLFLDRASQAPDALICGYPQYDSSVPKGRLYARYLTHVWVWINTLSLSIRDSMCGFRVYPLQPTLALLDSTELGKRMDFDTEILVRLHWREQPMVWLPTRVHYPVDGVSHFRLWRDNLLISSMHARLFGGMLLRAPKLLWRRWLG
ncbi:glycosyltransferase family 2 protein [Pseudomonas stutzeri]|uniref:glycosyltransferase family 2 protein n=1 Tax=Stutzerimonas stutzeri TaxID=316 RepID=UPI0021097701|nr:glycosyltransferase family 2 protein [Stutzerimonas stutzeri]MCQ4312549.1 glycosyltransferase family 2 protein [Stutzerimonas stutzeri]